MFGLILRARARGREVGGNVNELVYLCLIYAESLATRLKKISTQERQSLCLPPDLDLSPFRQKRCASLPPPEIRSLQPTGT